MKLPLIVLVAILYSVHDARSQDIIADSELRTTVDLLRGFNDEELADAQRTIPPRREPVRLRLAANRHRNACFQGALPLVKLPLRPNYMASLRLVNLFVPAQHFYWRDLSDRFFAPACVTSCSRTAYG